MQAPPAADPASAPGTRDKGGYDRVVLFVTIWSALALFVLAEAGKGPLLVDGHPRWWARPAWIAGAMLAIVHALIAFAVRYRWDHDEAVRATAAQAAAIYGTGWDGSLYVNYAFLALWLFAAWSWRHRAWRHWAWRAFVLTMIVNGAIVFARPEARPFGLVLTLTLLWAWWPRRSPAA
jgi:hypothetical protein